MDRGRELLKQSNIRVTQQRLIVYTVLLDEKKHFTAEEIYEKIKPVNPTISLATVYTILDILKKKNLINEIRIRFDKSSYEARIDWHHHFLCRRCNRIFDIDIDPCPDLCRRSINGHRIEHLQGYFYGICKKCQGR